MTPLDVLRGMRSRLSSPSRWTKNVLARDYTGEMVAPNSPSAVCFCLVGAACAEEGVCSIYVPTAGLAKDALGVLSSAVGDEVAKWNDDPSTTHADVLRVLDEAISVEKSCQP